jgi:hypothetical protein
LGSALAELYDQLPTSSRRHVAGARNTTAVSSSLAGYYQATDWVLLCGLVEVTTWGQVPSLQLNERGATGLPWQYHRHPVVPSAQASGGNHTV